VSSLSAYGFIISILTISTIVWFLRIEFESRSVRLLASLIAVSVQILIEVFLTFDRSPLRLSHVPYLHFVILVGVAISAREGITKTYNNSKSFTLLRKNSWKREYLGTLLKTYWFFIAFVIAFLSGIYPALLGGPSTVDERAYHWPQILGIVQNNGFTSFDSSLPWTYTYPLGKAMFSAFTWPFIQTDLAFRSVQILFALIATISIYIIGKHFSRNVGIISSLVLAASPVFAVTLRMSSDDLGYGSLVLAAAAFLCSANISKSTILSRKLFLFGLLSVALSGQFKFPVVSIILASPLILLYLIRQKSSYKNILIYSTLSLTSFGIGTVFAIRNFFEFRNPFYPMTVKIGNRSIFEGPLVAINNQSIQPSTTFSIDEPYRLLKIWHATFFDFFQVPNEDSLGSYNYVVGLLLIATFVFGLTKFISLSLTFKLLLISNLTVALIIPGVFHPRYGFFVIAVFVIFSINAFSAVIEEPKPAIFLGFAILMGLAPILIQNVNSRGWINSQSSGDMYNNGQSYVDRNIDLTPDGTVLPSKLVAWIQENVTEKKLVCYSAATNYPSAFWNLDRTSQVRYSPISESDRYPNSNNSLKIYENKEISTWLKRNIKCDYIVTYGSQDIEQLSKDNWQKVISEDSRNIWILGRRN
jgi:hypothetical protein